MQKVFPNGNERDGRYILIEIKNDAIYFYFNEQYKRQQEWIANEDERRLQHEEQSLTDDEKEISEFYWIRINEWISDKTQGQGREDNWHNHMKEKLWFTDEMENFIDANV